MSWPLILLVSCALFDDGADSPGVQEVLVEVGEAREGTVPDTWSTLADVRALERAELAAGASGQVVAVEVREGEQVAGGRQLVRVDDGVPAARLEVARATAAAGAEELARARRSLTRIQQVDEVVSPDVLDQAQASVATLEARQRGLEAQVSQAEAELALYRVRAPFDGVVVERHVDPGDWVVPGEPVLDLVSTGGVELRVDLTAQAATGLWVGHPATIRGTGAIGGQVVAVVPALDPVSRTARVRVQPDQEVPWLIPGAAVEVEFTVETGGAGVVVPRDALVLGPVEHHVVRVVDGRAEQVSVRVLATADDEALVAGELAAGDRLVTRGNERVRDGQPVRIR